MMGLAMREPRWGDAIPIGAHPRGAIIVSGNPLAAHPRGAIIVSGNPLAAHVEVRRIIEHERSREHESEHERSREHARELERSRERLLAREHELAHERDVYALLSTSKPHDEHPARIAGPYYGVEERPFVGMRTNLVEIPLASVPAPSHSGSSACRADRAR